MKDLFLASKAMAGLFLCTVICLSSCKDQPTALDPIINNSISISEDPIFISESTSEKHFYFGIPVSFKDHIQCMSGNQSLPVKVVNQNSGSDILNCMVIIPVSLKGQTLSIQYVEAENHHTIHELDIIGYSKEDTIELVTFHYLPPKPTIILKRECWPEYSGAMIGPGYDFTLSSRGTKEDVVISDSITRTITLEKVSLVDNDKRKSVDINSPVRFTYKDRNWLNRVSSKEHTITSPTSTLKYGIYSGDGGYPDYMLIGEIIGARIRMVSREHAKYDTIEVEDLLLPTHFQVGIGCQSPLDKNE